jgi:hypothetical protein
LAKTVEQIASRDCRIAQQREIIAELERSGSVSRSHEGFACRSRAVASGASKDSRPAFEGAKVKRQFAAKWCRQEKPVT